MRNWNAGGMCDKMVGVAAIDYLRVWQCVTSNVMHRMVASSERDQVVPSICVWRIEEGWCKAFCVVYAGEYNITRTDGCSGFTLAKTTGARASAEMRDANVYIRKSARGCEYFVALSGITSNAPGPISTYRSQC